MLVLSRRRGETICIGADIKITVLEVSGNRIRLGIVAPPQVNIWRDELEGVQPDAASSHSNAK